MALIYPINAQDIKRYHANDTHMLTHTHAYKHIHIILLYRILSCFRSLRNQGVR